MIKRCATIHLMFERLCSNSFLSLSLSFSVFLFFFIWNYKFYLIIAFRTQSHLWLNHTSNSYYVDCWMEHIHRTMHTAHHTYCKIESIYYSQWNNHASFNWWLNHNNWPVSFISFSLSFSLNSWHFVVFAGVATNLTAMGYGLWYHNYNYDFKY